MAYERLCRKDAVAAGDLRQFNVGEVEILVINFGDRFVCLDARCTHAGAPLAEGRLEGEVLVCPWHGSRFRVVDGSVVAGPARKPLRVYPNVVRDDQVFVLLQSVST